MNQWQLHFAKLGQCLYHQTHADLHQWKYSTEPQSQLVIKRNCADKLLIEAQTVQRTVTSLWRGTRFDTEIKKKEANTSTPLILTSITPLPVTKYSNETFPLHCRWVAPARCGNDDYGKDASTYFQTDQGASQSCGCYPVIYSLETSVMFPGPCCSSAQDKLLHNNLPPRAGHRTRWITPLSSSSAVKLVTDSLCSEPRSIYIHRYTHAERAWCKKKLSIPSMLLMNQGLVWEVLLPQATVRTMIVSE